MVARQLMLDTVKSGQLMPLILQPNHRTIHLRIVDNRILGWAIVHAVYYYMCHRYIASIFRFVPPFFFLLPLSLIILFFCFNDHRNIMWPARSTQMCEIYPRCSCIIDVSRSVKQPSPKWLKIISRTIASCAKERLGLENAQKILGVYIYILPLIGNCSSGGSSNHEARNAPVRDLFSLYFPPFSTISNKGAPFCRRKSTNDESWRKMKSNFNVFLFAIWLGTLEEKEKERKEGGGRSVANEIELNLKGPILRLHTRGTF